MAAEELVDLTAVNLFILVFATLMLANDAPAWLGSRARFIRLRGGAGLRWFGRRARFRAVSLNAYAAET
jgi:hypothetical protein